MGRTKAKRYPSLLDRKTPVNAIIYVSIDMYREYKVRRIGFVYRQLVSCSWCIAERACRGQLIIVYKDMGPGPGLGPGPRFVRGIAIGLKPPSTIMLRQRFI